ncbi:hypothetical protein B5S28_g1581 [[Candida] boidinii]|nr:hypothetical protein B5S28_g1581 [[Candida] boidinii]OWB61116.1 hypothetical protein B5S29_g2000 [[Candida] boidinii]
MFKDKLKNLKKKVDEIPFTGTNKNSNASESYSSPGSANSSRSNVSSLSGSLNVPSSLPSIRSINNRIKTSGESNLSQGLDDIKFKIEELQSYGIAGKVRSLAYDPVQSLMAMITEYNEIHIFGQNRVSSIIKLQTVNSIRALRFVKGIYLVAIDNLSTIFVISLHSKKVIHTIIAKLPITAFETDYSIEFIFVGFRNGYVKAYNIETGLETILSLKDQQRADYPVDADVHVCSIKFHPRDLSSLLISYPKVTVIYRLPDNSIENKFVYKLERGAPGGENSTYLYEQSGYYYPRVVESLWHPNGLHILTVHEDNSLVFWDAKTGEFILARTLFDSYVNETTNEDLKPAPQSQRMSDIKKICWLCEADSERTSLLIMGGDAFASEGYHQLMRIDFGKMLMYSVTSYNQMAKYYAQPKQQNIFAIHSSANVLDFVPLPDVSPYFNGCHNPKLIATIMTDGSLKFLNYPTGNLSFKASNFPSSVSWLNPKITCSASSYIDKTKLNSVMPTIKKYNTILKGGIPSKPKYKATVGSLIITGHENGYIRVWNSSEGQLDSASVLEIDISNILLNDSLDFAVSKVSFAAEILELSCSLYNNDVLLFSFMNNKNFQENSNNLTRRFNSLELSSTNNNKKMLHDIRDRAPTDIKKGFLPMVLVKSMDNGKVTALCNSNIGFVAIGYSSGQLVVIDRRGPAVIFSSPLKDTGLSITIVPTSIEFSFSTIDDNSNKCGIIMYVGTSIGRLMAYQIVNQDGSSGNGGGKYKVSFIGSLDTNESAITNIIAINPITGRPNSPTIQKITSPPETTDMVPSMVICSSSSDIRICKGIVTKLSHRSLGKTDIASVGITGTKTPSGKVGFCVVAILNRPKKILTLAIPNLSEISSIPLRYMVDTQFTDQSSVLPIGDVFLRISETEAALVNIMNTRTPILGLDTVKSEDQLFLNNVLVPWRPRINADQLIKGSASSLSYEKLYELLVGRVRPKNGRLEEYALAWDVSPYNPSNYNLLGNSKPQYFDPTVIHKSPHMNQQLKSPLTVNNVSNQFQKFGKYINTSLDAAASKVDTYVSDTNDDFDKWVSQTKKDTIKNVIGSNLGI